MAVHCAAAERGVLIKKSKFMDNAMVFRPTGRGPNNYQIETVIIHLAVARVRLSSTVNC